MHSLSLLLLSLPFALPHSSLDNLLHLFHFPILFCFPFSLNAFLHVLITQQAFMGFFPLAWNKNLHSVFTTNFSHILSYPCSIAYPFSFRHLILDCLYSLRLLSHRLTRYHPILLCSHLLCYYFTVLVTFHVAFTATDMIQVCGSSCTIIWPCFCPCSYSLSFST